MDAYKQLLEKYREILIIQQISDLMGWDQETYMPPGAVLQRGEQSAYLAKLAHKKITDPEIGKLLSEIQKKTSKDFTSNYKSKLITKVRRI